MKITLTLPERIQAATVGAQRQFQNIKNGRANTKGADESNSWQRHIEGAMAEMAVAKARGKFWSGTPSDSADMFDSRHEGDVDFLEVRQTPYHTGHLTIHDDDKPERYYALAVGVNGIYEIRGVKLCALCQRTTYWGDKWNNGRPAFWVPQSDLEPFDPKAPYDPLTSEELQRLSGFDILALRRKQSLRQPLDPDEQRALEAWNG